MAKLEQLMPRDPAAVKPGNQTRLRGRAADCDRPLAGV